MSTTRTPRGRLAAAGVAAFGVVLSGLLLPAVTRAAPVPADRLRSAAAAPDFVREHRVIGHSVRGRKIHAWYRGDPDPRRVLLLLGQMHGDEKAGVRTARWVRRNVHPRPGTAVWVVPTMNPDGYVLNTRRNARHVDLNRNWPTSGWTSAGQGSETWGGPSPASEPETRAMLRFLQRVRPAYIASIHQPLAAIGRTAGHRIWQRRLSHNLGLPIRYLSIGTPSGLVSPTLTGWYNRHYGRAHVATTIEYRGRVTTRFVTRTAGLGIPRAAGLLRR